MLRVREAASVASSSEGGGGGRISPYISRMQSPTSKIRREAATEPSAANEGALTPSTVEEEEGGGGKMESPPRGEYGYDVRGMPGGGGGEGLSGDGGVSYSGYSSRHSSPHAGGLYYGYGSPTAGGTDRIQSAARLSRMALAGASPTASLRAASPRAASPHVMRSPGNSLEHLEHRERQWMQQPGEMWAALEAKCEDVKRMLGTPVKHAALDPPSPSAN
jgi:hypothetical protein